jgi:CHAT domain-containing protein
MHREQPAGGHDVEGLELSERARARGLLELLKEARVNIREGVDPALLSRERELNQLIADKTIRQIRVLNRKYTPAQAEAIDKELKAIDIEYQRIEGQIRAASPRYAALTQPRPLTLAEIQRQALDEETMLLEYALGEDRSFLWAVTKTSHSSFELPKRAAIEEAAKRVYGLLTARAGTVPNETEAQRQARFAEADAEYAKASMELSRMLLAPIASRLGKQRLLIVGDGALQYVPFAALPRPETERRGDRETRGQGDKGRPRRAVRNQRSFTPLLVDREIVTLPSASTLALLREETAKRKPAGKTAAVFADPVFEATDDRVKSRQVISSLTGASKTEAARGASLLQAAQTRAIESAFNPGQPIKRLRFTQLEAGVIEKLVPAAERKIATGFDAGYEKAIEPELGDYRYVHFATHGLVNSEQPALSGVLLSLVDERGQPRKNGLLGLGDIYNLKLSADLVVLSACQTALGKDVKGEGLVGLTRGFMYAGAPRVIASLWSVDDQATAELMARFYHGLLRQRLRPAAALRQAQIAMWRNKDWQSPYFWGAFTLQGEWK